MLSSVQGNTYRTPVAIWRPDWASIHTTRMRYRGMRYGNFPHVARPGGTASVRLMAEFLQRFVLFCDSGDHLHWVAGETCAVRFLDFSFGLAG